MIVGNTPYNMTCDICKRKLLDISWVTVDVIFRVAYKRGWLHIPNPPDTKGMDKDLCPDCQNKDKPKDEFFDKLKGEKK